MLSHNNNKLNPLLLLTLLLGVLLDVCYGQLFAFPEPEKDEKLKNAQNRTPLFIPSRCNENELLYPGDQENDWICDCAPGHLYNPATLKCYPAYRKGPCKNGEILILPKGKVIPECKRNSCPNDGEVNIRNKCYTLGEAGPCLSPELSNVIGVNPSTLEISCVRLSVAVNNRLGEEIDNILSIIDLSTVPICPPGSERSIYNRCPVKKL